MWQTLLCSCTFKIFLHNVTFKRSTHMKQGMYDWCNSHDPEMSCSHFRLQRKGSSVFRIHSQFLKSWCLLLESKLSKWLPAVLTFCPDVFYFIFFVFESEQLDGQGPNGHSLFLTWLGGVSPGRRQQPWMGKWLDRGYWSRPTQSLGSCSYFSAA